MPHLTQMVAMKLPLEFPCKEQYEKTNATSAGLLPDRAEDAPDEDVDGMADDGEDPPPPPPDGDAVVDESAS